MANANYTPVLQNLGAGDERALALKEFSGMVSAKFAMRTKCYQNIWRKSISSGSSHQFPFIGWSDYEEHTPGTEMTGSGKPPTEERLVPVDDKEIISDAHLNKVDDFIAHYEVRDEWAMSIAGGLGRQIDSRCMRMVAQGARIATRTVTYPDGSTQQFDSGVLVRNNAASVAAAYPVTVAGSEAFQDDLGAMAQGFEEREIPDDAWICYITPYLKRVLLKDKSIASKDYQDPLTNRIIQRVVDRVQGFRIEVTNNLPNSSVTTLESAYRGNYTYVAALCTAHPMSVGAVEFMSGLDTWGPTWHEDKRSHHLGAAHFGGIKWLRPEACGEIYVNTSDYTLSGGAYAP